MAGRDVHDVVSANRGVLRRLRVFVEVSLWCAACKLAKERVSGALTYKIQLV